VQRRRRCDGAAVRRRPARGAPERSDSLGVGGIGAFIVASAAARGISPLIAVDIDEDRLETARRLGADVRLNASGGDLVRLVRDASDGEGADVVIEASGAAVAPAAAIAAARRGGRVLLVGLQSGPRELDLLALTVQEIELTTTVAHVGDVDLPRRSRSSAAGT
jgi:threonine dehydrogenase-like Zn-dependent dehydrogenase